jgi:multisubunit Na+/H+ antiporter MnhB subunit
MDWVVEASALSHFSPVGLALDLLLAAGLLWLAWRVLYSPDLFLSVVLFISFGLLVSLAYLRLRAPDVAMAEAAIGAALTGTLLLYTLRHMGVPVEPPRLAQHRLLTGLALLMSAGLGWAILAIPGFNDGLVVQVTEQLRQSGVEHSVTAVLLNFRAYDTMLEVAVLLLALVGVWAVSTTELRLPAPAGVLRGMVGLLLPPGLLVGGYLLWVGAYQPGGAFQGGAVLGGLLVLLLLAGWRTLAAGWLLRLALGAGLLAFLAVGVLAMVGASLLEYRLEAAKNLILFIEFFVALSVAATLAMLLLGRPPGSAGEQQP